MIKVVLSQHSGILGFFEELRNGILDTSSVTIRILNGTRMLCALTLDINLNTDV